ncbi:MAG: class I SAM-dependent methyltransferase [Rhodospirillales bacterium]|nr:MAG: class I SAM-dependent methyltransferase [Rhodospirillales bacterium]
MSIDLDLGAPATTRPPTALPPWLLRRVVRGRCLDAVLRRRAADIVAKTGLDGRLPADARCLDIGAGLGHLAEALLADAPRRRCVGVDPVWMPADRLRRRLDRSAAGRWRFLGADGRRLPFAAGAFDVAWMAFVLHHVPYDEQWRLLDEARRVLRPGGAFLLLEDTPATDAEWRIVEASDRRLNVEAADEPHHYRGPGEWRAVLARQGFTIEAEIPFSRVFPRASFAAVPHTAFVCRVA